MYISKYSVLKGLWLLAIRSRAQDFYDVIAGDADGEARRASNPIVFRIKDLT